VIELGPYTLLRRFSVGGMAELFLAVHREDPGRRLVVKRILPQLATRPDVVRMFLDEGRLTSHLHHENLVQVFDVGQADATPFIVLEYVDGLPLSELLRRQWAKRIPYPLACWLVAEVCAGLAYAHGRTDLEGNPLGIVHRDVSPDNILLSRAGEVKLTDFGIAKAASQLARTRPGQVKGKLAYMSPEQLRNYRIDARSDLFSLGLVLYEATVGKRAFPLGAEVDLLRSLLAGDYAPPERELPDYPPELAGIIARCLAVDVERRYQRAAELRRALLALVPEGEWASDLAGRVAEALRAPPRSLGEPGSETASLVVLAPQDLESLVVEPDRSALTTAPERRVSPPPLPPEKRSDPGDEPDTTVIPAIAGITRVEPFPGVEEPDTVPEVGHLREPSPFGEEYEPEEDTVRDSHLLASLKGVRKPGSR
jgi:serine/threonine-protein kinase